MLSPYDFATLCRVAQAVLTQFQQIKKKKEIEHTFKACLKVNDVRNQIVHGTWLLGSGTRHVSRQTLEPSIYLEQTDEIVEKTREIKKLQKDIADLQSLVNSEKYSEAVFRFLAIPCWPGG